MILIQITTLSVIVFYSEMKIQYRLLKFQDTKRVWILKTIIFFFPLILDWEGVCTKCKLLQFSDRSINTNNLNHSVRCGSSLLQTERYILFWKARKGRIRLLTAWFEPDGV